MYFPVYLNDKVSNFFILIGLPGVGKTSFCRILEDYFKSISETRVIERDQIRCDLIWEKRKDEDLAKIIPDLDPQVNKVELMLVKNAVDDNQTVILDGCHSEIFHLLNIIRTIKNKNPESNVSLIFLGDENSRCFHSLSDNSEGDYSDYEPDFSHTSIPKVVLDRKRKELKGLIEHFTKGLKFHADALYFLPQKWLKEIPDDKTTQN